MATNAPANGASGSDRASIIAELASLAADDAPAEAAPSEEAPIEAPADGSTEEVEAAADESDEGVDAEPDAEPTDEDDPEETSDDPKVAKGLDQVRRAEKRSRERLDAEKQAFAAEREQFLSEWKPKIEAAERFERLRESARNPYAIADLLLEAGMSEDDFEAAAQTLYAHSAKGKADPKYKEAVARSKRERDLASEVANLKKWRDEREQQERAAAEQARLVAEGHKIIDGIVKAAKPEKAPLLTAALAKNAEKTQARLAQIAADLYDREGVMPKAHEVHAEYERARREELIDLGIDPATVIKTAPKAPTKPAAPATKAKPAANINGTAKSDPSRDEIVAELARLS